MTLLDIVLAVKILGTGLLAGLPLTLLPAARLSSNLNVDSNAVPYLRLYGVAIIALLVGYSSGFSTFNNGVFPLGVVLMGIVSNGLGTLTIFVTGVLKQNRLMTALIGSITVALLICLIHPELAMSSI